MKKDLTEQIFTLLLQLRKHMMNAMNTQVGKEREQRVATALQFHTLRNILEKPRITVGELASELNMSSGAIAQLIDRLTTSKWILRETSDIDRRIIHLSLTEEGKEELLNMKKTFFKKYTSILSFISDEDKKDLIRILTNLLTGLKKKNE